MGGTRSSMQLEAGISLSDDERVRQLPTGTITFLFTDIEGSTGLLEEHGEAYAELLEDHRRVLRAAFVRHGGVEVDTQGDAFFVAFGRASDAIAAAEEAQAKLELPVRIGIHTGEPQLTGEGYVGMDVHRAARICGAGHGGQVLLSQATADLVWGEFRDYGQHRLKDVGELRLYQLGNDDFPPLRSLNQTNLPAPPDPLVGRKRERAHVLGVVRDEHARLVTITGPGGIGKTRFALELAAELVEDFRDGVWFVDLSPLRDAELVVPTIAGVLGAKTELADHIADKEVQLVLDNFEQVIDAAPAIASLLERCRNLHLLVTSREPSRVRGERRYPLRPLAESPAVELFCRRAEEVDPSFGGSYEELADICRLLDNLPLALELAAARTATLTASQLLARLEERLPLLASRAPDVPERQRTLRATIEWSYDLLDSAEQELFARLAVFAGGFTLEAAEEVCDADLDALESLVEKSLVRYEAERFSMLETVREFAQAALGNAEQKRLVPRYCAYYIRLAERTAELRAVVGKEIDIDRIRLDALAAELDNYRNALGMAHARGDRETMLRLCVALRHLWLRRGGIHEGSRWIALAQSVGDELEEALEGKGLFVRGSLAWARGDADEAEAAFTRLGAATRIDASLAVSAQVGLAAVARARGDLDGAAELLEAALAIRRKGSDSNALRRVLHHLGEVERDRGNFRRARELLEEAVAIATDMGAEASRAGAVHGLADVALDERRLEEAAARYRKALEIATRIGLPPVRQLCLLGLAAVAAATGEARRAAVLWRAAELLGEEYELAPPAYERARYDRVFVEFTSEELVAALALEQPTTVDRALAEALE
jgi:predicted ATPase/class 3 adenylate cyclase